VIVFYVLSLRDNKFSRPVTFLLIYRDALTPLLIYRDTVMSLLIFHDTLT